MENEVIRNAQATLPDHTEIKADFMNLFISQNPFEHKHNTCVLGLGKYERILERSIWNVFLRLQFIKVSFAGLRVK